MTHLYLTEYKQITLPAEALPYHIGVEIDRRYRRYLTVEFPSPRTDGRWRLTAHGWVGHIPLSQAWQLTIHTKVPVTNLWQLLTWAYDWHSWRLFSGEVQTSSLPAFYNGLAQILAEQVQQLARHGLFGTYQPRTERLNLVRGRLQLKKMVQTPISPSIACKYEQYTIDNIYNQILALALQHIGRCGLCTPETARVVQKARRALPIAPSTTTVIDWQAVTYTRLNQSYRPLHTLCKFFLDGLLPNLQSGADAAVPFLINMSLLYEQFVAAWLDHHLSADYRLRTQERVMLDGTNGRQIAIDLVLYNDIGEPLAVLDTKYKAPKRPDMADIYQVTFYAHQQNCPAAYLIYPADLVEPIAGTNRDVTYRNLTFPLVGDLAENGRLFLKTLQHHE